MNFLHYTFLSMLIVTATLSGSGCAPEQNSNNPSNLDIAIALSSLNPDLSVDTTFFLNAPDFETLQHHDCTLQNTIAILLRSQNIHTFITSEGFNDRDFLPPADPTAVVGAVTFNMTKQSCTINGQVVEVLDYLKITLRSNVRGTTTNFIIVKT